MRAKKLAVGSLIEDFTIYPRHRVDESHVADLVRAIDAGVALPPVIVEAKSLRIVDGWHRCRACRRHDGEEAVVLAEVREYVSEAELFLDAVELNATHGRKLDRHDQTRIVLRLRELHVSDQQIASRLHIPAASVVQLAVRIVVSQAGEIVPAKRGLEHLRGQVLTTEQLQVMGSVRSAEVGRLCIELQRLLETDMVDLNDQRTVERLRVLSGVIEGVLANIAA